MWGILHVLCAWGLVGAFAETGQRVMGGLYWCNTLCMCTTQTNIQVQCFERPQVYQLVGIPSKNSRRLEKNNWFLEERVNWCTDICLCHKHNNKEFRCTEEEKLVRFISDTIGDGYFNDTDVEAGEEDMQQPLVEEVEEEQAVETEENREDPEHRKRSERRKNKKNRKQRKNRQRQGENNTSEEEEEDMATSEAPTPVYEAQPEPEPESEPEPRPYEQDSEPTQPATTTTTTTSTTTTTTTTSTTTPSPPLPQHRGEMSGDGMSDEEEEERGEPLPKQEAVAASPAVTALQPPTRRQPFPSTVEAYTPRSASSREADVPPKMQPILEVPKEKKTVASKVSQDLDELGSTVLEIQSDVVLNQRILLVAVAIAGIAMLGVIVLAIHGCAARRNPPLEHTSKKRDAAKDDNHVTKLNMEEAW